MVSLLDRLKERKLVQWALAYLAGAWLLLQVLDLLGDNFEWPRTLIRSATVLLGVGFLAALVLAWYHGEQARQRVSGPELLMLAALLTMAGVGVALVASLQPLGPEATHRGAPELASSAAEEAIAEEASVVVLPFADLSPQRDEEYFADGLTEEILNALVRIPQLRVPARTTSFSFKGTNRPVPEIARQLGVAHVLEGSVRKDGDRLRIMAQLVEARGDRQLWSERYDRQLADVFAVQEEIAQAVAGALQVRLVGAGGFPLPGADHRLTATGTSNPAVYELYLRGLHAWNRRTPESLRDAVAYFQHAVERDSSFARGWAGLALTYVLLPEYADTLTSAWIPRTHEAARRALALDPGLAEAHTALGQAHELDWNFEAAEQAFRRAVEVNPSYPTAYQWYGAFLNTIGKPEEARSQFERALELDPLSFILNGNLADQLFYLRQYERALVRYRLALELSPAGAPDYRAQYAVALLFAGRERDALAQVDALLAQIDEGHALKSAQAGYVLARTERSAEARTIARRLEARARQRFVSPVARAYLYVGLREYELAFALLEEAETVRDPLLLNYLPNAPIFDPLRGDARFVRKIQRLRIH